VTPFQFLAKDIRKVHPEARVHAFTDIGTDTWRIAVRFNAITTVQVLHVPSEDFTEDFLSDDLLTAILDQREGGKDHVMSYAQAKELTKALS
jgi:hypothetical protein